jgi:sulfur-oxidizing protein SoxY
MLNKLRRLSLVSGLTIVAASLLPKVTFAALNRKLFEANMVAEVLKNLPEKDAPEPSNRLLIDVPEVSLDPERIPVRIRSELPGTDMMLLMAATVVPPAIAQFTIPVGVEAEIQTQIRLKGTTTVQLIVRAGGKLYTAQKEVKIAVPFDNKFLSE